MQINAVAVKSMACVLAGLFLVTCSPDVPHKELPEPVHTDSRVQEKEPVSAQNISHNERRKYFRSFFQKFKALELPLVMHLNGDNIDIDGPLLDMDSGDTLFVKTNREPMWTLYGRLNDTSRFYAFIVMYPADGPVPVLYTYSKDLRLLSAEELVARGCGADCGVKHCTTTGIINKDFSIYCADTMEYVECDQQYREIENTRHKDVEYLEGKIGMTGKVVLSGLKKVDLIP